MAKSKELGLTGVEAVHFFVNDLERWMGFWVDELDFAYVGATPEGVAEKNGYESHVIRAGQATYILSKPLADGNRVAEYLSEHPAGIGEVVFGVEDAEKTLAVLESRGGTPISNVRSTEGQGGTLSWFSITTPFGDTQFTFAQRDGYRPVLPGIEMHADAKGGDNKFGFREIDHLTSNFLTLAPVSLWLENVLGLERYWGIEFHTDDVAPQDDHGSGLKSTVMWCPHSGVKFANNEPMRPFFEDSQIYKFVRDNRGAGIQHTALTIEDIVSSVPAMRESGVTFMPTPGTYYDALPERLEQMEITLEEEIDDLRGSEILVDGEGPGRYLLQIFCKDMQGLFSDPAAGPFFLEIIQRKGDRGFGGGNFRALFESIERDQKAQRG